MTIYFKIGTHDSELYICSSLSICTFVYKKRRSFPSLKKLRSLSLVHTIRKLFLQASDYLQTFTLCMYSRRRINQYNKDDFLFQSSFLSIIHTAETH